MEKERKSFRQVLENLKAIRRQPVPREKIEEFNRIVEKDDQHEQREQEKRKIARSPEADI
jgi:hypothetical protein